MYIYFTVLIGLMGICMGSIVGVMVAEKINHDYFLNMNNNFETYFTNMIKIEEKFFDDVTKYIMSAINDINKVYEKPIWRKTEEELPPCSGLYYGKIKDNPHGENAMWKVVYNDNEWSLSGYPDNKVEISAWTEIY